MIGPTRNEKSPRAAPISAQQHQLKVSWHKSLTTQRECVRFTALHATLDSSLPKILATLAVRRRAWQRMFAFTNWLAETYGRTHTNQITRWTWFFVGVTYTADPAGFTPR